MTLQNRLTKLILWLTCGWAGFMLVFSLFWRMRHDTPLIHYAAFLMNEHGAVPYRDFFETSWVGTFLIHAGFTRLFGYGDFAFMLDNLANLALLGLITWHLMKPFGRQAALFAIALFAAVYLGHGPSIILQRDYLGILPIALAVLLSLQQGAGSLWRQAAIGFLFGCAASIKPHLAIAAPLVVLFTAIDKRQNQWAKQLPAIAIEITVAIIGFTISFGLPLLWLWDQGGFPAFWDMLTQYLPLHQSMNGQYEVLDGGALLIGKVLRFGVEMAFWVVPAGGALFLYFGPARPVLAQHKRALYLVALAALYALYTWVAGKFWDYHWMPMTYFACLLTAHAMADQRPGLAHIPAKALILLLGLASLAWQAQPRPLVGIAAKGIDNMIPKQGKPDAIAAYLKANLNPGDIVQPIDWTEGAIHGMLLARAPIATRYMYDYHFYHHVSDPFIAELRADFIQQLKANRPRYLIKIKHGLLPTGHDTAADFPALAEFMGTYVVAHKGDGFTILEAKPAHP